MASRSTFSVTCPCCGATLTLDEEAKVVVHHEASPAGKKTSFEERMNTIEEEKRLAEEKFQESIRAEKSKKEVLEQKFQDLFKKAKEGPIEPMTRDIDLD